MLNVFIRMGNDDLCFDCESLTQNRKVALATACVYCTDAVYC